MLYFAFFALMLAVFTACATSDQTVDATATSASPTAAPLTATNTPTATPSATATSLPTATTQPPPSITPLPSALDDHPAKLRALELNSGSFITLHGTVEKLVDEQDWLAIFVSPAAEDEVTFELEMQCGGGDTARVAIFDSSVTEGLDIDSDGRLSYEEAFDTGTAVESFEMGCLQNVSATLPGGADYYIIVYPSAGGRTGYVLFLSR